MTPADADPTLEPPRNWIEQPIAFNVPLDTRGDRPRRGQAAVYTIVRREDGLTS